jgi:signal transduction histidine kinase
MTGHVETAGKIDEAFHTALVLTGTVQAAEAAVLDGISALRPDTSCGDDLLLETAKCSIARDLAFPRPIERAAAIPRELRRLFYLDPIYRYSFALRILLGLTPGSCGAILNLSVREFDAVLQTALQMLVIVESPGDATADAHLRRLDGEYRRSQIAPASVQDDQGNLIRRYTTATDIDDRKKTDDLRLEERVNERTRIARELHDTLLQSFQGLLLKFSALKYVIRDRPVEAEEEVERMAEEARRAIIEGRDAVMGLRSFTGIGTDLARAITTFGEGFAGATGSPQFGVRVEGQSRDLPPLVLDEVYRIASEAVRNAFRHAGARRIEVEIHFDNREFHVRVRDDGKGIDPKVLDAGGRAGHHGMPGMHERAKLAGGELTVRSELDSGAEIDLTIPAALAYVEASVANQTRASDKEPNHEIARQLWPDAGAGRTAAVRGSGALEVLQGGRIQL